MRSGIEFRLAIIFNFVIGIALSVLINLIASSMIFEILGVGSAWEFQYDHEFDIMIDQMYKEYSLSSSYPVSQIVFNGKVFDYDVVKYANGVRYGFMKMDISNLILASSGERACKPDVLIVTKEFSLRSYNEQYLFCVELKPPSMTEE